MDERALRAPDDAHRAVCWRCRRPQTHCYCALVPTLETKTRVVFLQHPRERHVAIGTARMAHLALPSSSFIEGTRLDDDPRLASLFVDDGVAVLFPGEGARDLTEWRPPPTTLVVLDGTWWQAKKLLTLNPRLASLPRLSYAPSSPGNYRIRTEPSDTHLATIEATAAVLGALEGDPARFEHMLRPFTFMVDRQIDAAQTTRRPRHRVIAARPARVSSRIAPLAAHPERAVFLYAEANAHPRDARARGAPEVLHVVLSRPASDARLSIVIAPRRPLAPNVPAHIELDEETILQGEDVTRAMARVAAFLASPAVDTREVRAPLVVVWGPYARDLLAREGLHLPGFVDLRAAAKESLGRATGGVPGAAAQLSVDDAPALPGRAGRVLAHMEGIARALVARLASEDER
mgnify:CR=1 FL=1